MLSGKRIILGVTGGIAAYKAVFLLRELQKAGAEVRVTMTADATRFIGIETFAALSKHQVAVEIFPDGKSDPDSWTQHISWGEWADLFIIAPCTANTLAKIAHGHSDNMLTSTILAARCPILICPTMDGEMFEAPGTQRNIKVIEEFGYNVLEPDEGYLASGLQGKGRLPETDAILNRAKKILSKKKAKGPLSGKKVVVTAGPTREHIDPVRFISNPSSGKMGFAMAEAAHHLDGEVTLLHGPVSVPLPCGIASEKFESAAELFERVQENADADVIIMAAAVSDFTPAEQHQHKVKKDKASTNLSLTQTTDILRWLGEHKREGQILIGFAMETEKLQKNATKKLHQKNADWIVANSLSEEDAGFGVDTNTVHLIGHEESREFSGSKKEVACQLLRHIFGSK
jgi:phosphopantothenoylcysteine decarboxylase/phosphopantothenate--cysteine ligase